LTKSGQRWDEDKSKLFQLEEKIVYRYDPAGRYHEVFRTGKPLELSLPVTGRGADDYDAADPFVPTTGSEAASDASSRALLEKKHVLPDSDGYVDTASKNMNPPLYP